MSFSRKTPLRGDTSHISSSDICYSVIKVLGITRTYIAHKVGHYFDGRKEQHDNNSEQVTWLLQPHVGVQCVALLLHILEVPGSNLSPQTGYPE
jgi:hypothetical protein